jgi:hypothetical protein
VNVESTARTIPDPCPYASDADVWALCGPAQCDSCAIGSAYSSSSLGVAVERPNLHELLTNPVSCDPWHQKQPSPPVEAAAQRMACSSCHSASRDPAGTYTTVCDRQPCKLRTLHTLQHARTSACSCSSLRSLAELFSIFIEAKIAYLRMTPYNGQQLNIRPRGRDHMPGTSFH